MPTETVLITGASSGIGRALAQRFAADGSQLVLVARRKERLEQLAEELRQQHGAHSLVMPCDLSRPDAPQELFQQLQQQAVAVDVLVNNAGFGKLGRFVELSLEEQLEMVQLNVTALTHLSRLFLPGMVERNRGGILNLGSTAAFQPGPHVAVYYASKAFVLSLSEALAWELRKTKVRVTCLCPGPTHTEFGERSHMHDTPAFKANAMDVDTVATAGHRGFRRGKRIVMPGVLNNLLSWSVRVTPRQPILRVVSSLQPLPDESSKS